MLERSVNIREKQPTSPIGGVLFTTGGYGLLLYGNQSPSITSGVFNGGYQTFELAWGGINGWGTRIAGAGIKDPMCGYSEVARWLHANRMITPATMCATGNSGGSFQIAYGLAVYGLEDIIDMAVLSGGPPTSDLDIACFGADATSADGTWPSNLPARSTIVDPMMGWTDPGENYCQFGFNNSFIPLSAHTEAQNNSIVSPTETRDLSYPTTKVNFVEGGLDAQRFNGKIYHDAITTNKSWQVLSGVDHNVHQSSLGATTITNLILTDCH